MCPVTNHSVILILSGKAQLLIKKTEDKIRNDIEDIQFQLRMEEYPGMSPTAADKGQKTPWEEFEAKKGDLFKMLYTKHEYFNQNPFLPLYNQDLIYAEGSQFGENWPAGVQGDGTNNGSEEVPPPRAVIAVTSLLTVAKIDLLDYDTIFERKSVEEGENIRISTFLNEYFFPLEGNANLFRKVVASSRKISVLFRETCFEYGDKQSHIYFVYEGIVKLIFPKDASKDLGSRTQQGQRADGHNALSKENQKLGQFFIKSKKSSQQKPLSINLAQGCMIGAENVSLKTAQVIPTFKYSCVSNSYRVTLLAISVESIRSFCNQYPVFSFFMRKKIKESQTMMKERVERLLDEASHFMRVLSEAQAEEAVVETPEQESETDAIGSSAADKKAQYKINLPANLAGLSPLQLWRQLPSEIQERLGLEDVHEKRLHEKKLKVLELMEVQFQSMGQDQPKLEQALESSVEGPAKVVSQASLVNFGSEAASWAEKSSASISEKVQSMAFPDSVVLESKEKTSKLSPRSKFLLAKGERIERINNSLVEIFMNPQIARKNKIRDNLKSITQMRRK